MYIDKLPPAEATVIPTLPPSDVKRLWIKFTCWLSDTLRKYLMSICKTGHCGFPCTCKESYATMNKDEASALKELVENRLAEIATDAASSKMGETMVACKAVEARLKYLKIDGDIYPVDHLLHRATIHPRTSKLITSTSGMRTVIVEDGVISFVNGRESNQYNGITFDVLNYKGDVSVSVDTFGDSIAEAYIQIVPTTTYLPKDMGY